MFNLLLLIATPLLQEVQLSPPVRVKAGDAWLGTGRMYASPAAHDVNGDGHLDILIGDLPGQVTVALGNGEFPPTFSTEEDLIAADGNALEFDNW